MGRLCRTNPYGTTDVQERRLRPTSHQTDRRRPLGLAEMPQGDSRALRVGQGLPRTTGRSDGGESYGLRDGPWSEGLEELWRRTAPDISVDQNPGLACREDEQLSRLRQRQQRRPPAHRGGNHRRMDMDDLQARRTQDEGVVAGGQEHLKAAIAEGWAARHCAPLRSASPGHPPSPAI